MPAARGSRQLLRVVKEVTFGVTPTNPVLIEIPVTSFNRDISRNLIRSDQIRTHPFSDRLMKGQQTQDIEIAVELQDDTHDLLFETLFGALWVTNSIKVADAISSLSLEAQAQDLALFDQFSGLILNRVELSFPAEADGKVTATFGGMAKAATLDAATSIIGTGSMTAAPSVDPYTFLDSAVTIGGAARPVTSLTLTLERAVDPLIVLGAATPREYIAGQVTCTGRLTVPWEDNVESTRLVNFTNAALVATAAQTSPANSRVFTMPAVYYARMGRRLATRGGMMQEIDFEARYDATLASVLKIDRT